MNWQSFTKNISERKRLKYNVLYRTRSAITHTIFSWLYWGSGLWKKWSWSLRRKILFWDTYLCNLCAVLIAHTQGNCSPKIVYNNSDRWGDGEWGCLIMVYISSCYLYTRYLFTVGMYIIRTFALGHLICTYDMMMLLQYGAIVFYCVIVCDLCYIWCI